mmetsp:Transcript_4678/g.6694  ORF Transcript_4678/g.6694 Transcript_4678/m.6694 type:complete len:140 (+) Transcript_4678:1-420(+)
MAVMLGAMAQTPMKGHGMKMNLEWHPFSMDDAWTWLNRYLQQLNFFIENKRKLPMPTGCILEGFLKTVGFSLDSKYGRRFKSLLRQIKLSVLPLLVGKNLASHLLDFVLDEAERNDWTIGAPEGRGLMKDLRDWEGGGS